MFRAGRAALLSAPPNVASALRTLGLQGSRTNTAGQYNSLGKDDLKDAYKKLARKYHPDVARTGDAEKFKEATAAYKMLLEMKEQGQKMKGALDEEFTVSEEHLTPEQRLRRKRRQEFRNRQRAQNARYHTPESEEATSRQAEMFPLRVLRAIVTGEGFEDRKVCYGAFAVFVGMAMFTKKVCDSIWADHWRVSLKNPDRGKMFYNAFLPAPPRDGDLPDLPSSPLAQAPSLPKEPTLAQQSVDAVSRAAGCVVPRDSEEAKRQQAAGKPAVNWGSRLDPSQMSSAKADGTRYTEPTRTELEKMPTSPKYCDATHTASPAVMQKVGNFEDLRDYMVSKDPNVFDRRLMYARSRNERVDEDEIMEKCPLVYELNTSAQTSYQLQLHKLEEHFRCHGTDVGHQDIVEASALVMKGMGMVHSTSPASYRTTIVEYMDETLQPTVERELSANERFQKRLAENPKMAASPSINIFRELGSRRPEKVASSRCAFAFINKRYPLRSGASQMVIISGKQELAKTYKKYQARESKSDDAIRVVELHGDEERWRDGAAIAPGHVRFFPETTLAGGSV